MNLPLDVVVVILSYNPYTLAMSVYLSKEIAARLDTLRRGYFKYKPFSLEERGLCSNIQRGHVSQGNLLLHDVGYVCPGAFTITVSLSSRGIRYGEGRRTIYMPRKEETVDLWTMERLFLRRGYRVDLKEELARLYYLYQQEGTVEGLLRWHAYLWIHRILRGLPTISMVWMLPFRLKDPASYCVFLVTQAANWYQELLGTL